MFAVDGNHGFHNGLASRGPSVSASSIDAMPVQYRGALDAIALDQRLAGPLTGALVSAMFGSHPHSCRG